MKAPAEKFHRLMSAVTFAEAGEWETAMEMLPAVKKNAVLSWFDRIFVAVAFAEADLHNEAVRVVNGRVYGRSNHESFLEAVGLAGVSVTYGTLTLEAA